MESFFKRKVPVCLTLQFVPTRLEKLIMKHNINSFRYKISRFPSANRSPETKDSGKSRPEPLWALFDRTRIQRPVNAIPPNIPHPH